MPELLSPFAPLHPWLDACTLSLAPIDPPFNVTDLAVDCRDIANRLVILQTLAAHGHPLPWALGGIWSALTDEQAARVTAEAVRAVGADPTEPASVVPIAALRQWSPHHCDQLAGTAFEGRVRGKGRSRGWEWRVWNRGAGMPPMAVSGPETGDAGCAMANATAQSLGALLWEQITPPEKSDV